MSIQFYFQREDIPCALRFLFLVGLIYLSQVGLVKSQSAEEIMQRVVEHYHNSILKTPYAAPAAYLEKAPCDGVYCMYTEATGYLFSLGYDYHIEVANFAFLPDNMKKSDRKAPWLATFSNIYAESAKITHRTDLWPGYDNLFKAFRWFEINGPFGSPRSFSYTIVGTGERYQTEPNLIKIDFEPRRRGNYAGTFYIDSNTWAVHRVELEKARYYSQNFRQWLSAAGEIAYNTDSKTTSISYIKFSFEKDQMEYRVEFQSFPTIEHYSEIDDRESLALYSNSENPYVFYQADAWPSSSPFPGIDSARIRNDLEAEASLEEQFKSNSGRSFFSYTYDDGRVMTVFGGEETYEIVRQIRDRLNMEFSQKEDSQ